MQWRIERTDSYRESIHRPENADKIRTLHGQQFLERGTAIFLVARQNHGPHVLDPVFAKKHVLGAAQADSLGAECPCLDGIARDIGVGTDSQLAKWFRPAHELHE